MIKKIEQHHGAGGRQSQDFIENLVLRKLGNEYLNKLDDSTVFDLKSGLLAKGSRLAMTTDSYVVQPLFFDGGDIGRLCIAGTCNDLSTSGAKPYALSLSLILEEGFDGEKLEKIFDSIKETLEEADVQVVTGDTKVVEKGKGDGIFINTCGIGVIEEGVHLSTYNAKVGDIVMITGNIGDHEVALMKARKMVPFDFEIKSDAAPLNRPLQKVLEKTKDLHVVKDPTRGGVAQALHEIADHSKVDIHLNEEELPLSREVKGVAELAGLDPLYMANEGKFVIICPETSCQEILAFFPEAKKIGVVKEKESEKKPQVFLKTVSGGLRKIPMMEVVQLPRIC